MATTGCESRSDLFLLHLEMVQPLMNGEGVSAVVRASPTLLYLTYLITSAFAETQLEWRQTERMSSPVTPFATGLFLKDMHLTLTNWNLKLLLLCSSIWSGLHVNQDTVSALVVAVCTFHLFAEH